MAFSAFRLMMGANHTSAPVILTDTITQEVAALVQNQTSGSGSTAQYAINYAVSTGNGTSNKVVVYSPAKNPNAGYTLFTWLPTKLSSGPTITSAAPLSVGTQASGSIGLGYNSNQGLGAVDNEASNSLTINWLNTTNTTISSSASHTTASNITYNRMVAMGSGALAASFALLSSTASSTYLFNSSGSYDSLAAGPSDVSGQMSMLSLSSSLGVCMYNTSGNLIKVFTFNVSGSTITNDSSVTTSITAASGGTMAFISSTQMLFVYKKSANTLAARVVTVATGSTFTFGTEYTATATGITDDPIGHVGEFTSSGDFGVTWINANGQGCCTLMSVSGSVVSLSNPNIYHTANDVIAYTDYYSSDFIGLSSSQAMIVYMIKSGALTSQTGLIKAVTVDLNYSTSSNAWNSTFSGNIKTTASIGITSNASYNTLDMDTLGTDRYLTATTVSTTTITLNTIDNDYAIGLLNTSQTFSGGSSAVTGACVVNVGASGTTARALIVYQQGGSQVACNLAQVSQDGATITVGSQATGAGSNNTFINAVNYTTDKTLVVYTTSTTLTAAIITTSGTSTPTIGSATSIITGLSGTSGAMFGMTVLDSSHVMVGYASGSGAGKVVIVNISGSTITAGTAVSIGTGPSGPISSCLHPGTAGAGSFFFTDNVSGFKAFAQGFTYSGTTITLGAASHQVSTSTAHGPSAYKSTIVSTQNNDALTVYVNGTSGIESTLITYTGSNSYTIGTQYVADGIQSTYAAFVTPDCYSKATIFSDDGTSKNLILNNAYRI